MPLELLTAIEQSALASALRASRWVYPLVNASHILGLALLFGAIVVHDTCVLASRPGEDAPRLPIRIAAIGLGTAVLTGLALASVKATEYAANPAFRLKLALLAVALLNILFVHRLASTARHFRLGALVSVVVWVAIIVAGRMIAFV